MTFSAAAATKEAAMPAAETGADPALPMAIIGVVLIVTFVFIAFEKLPKSLAALLGAVVAVALALFLGVYGPETGYNAVHSFISHDLGVIGVIVGTSILVEVVGGSGLFHFLAMRLVKLTRGDPRLLLPAVMAATVAFVTFLTIAPGVLIMSSLVLVITRALDDDPVPYIMAVAIGANSGALMTFASGIPTLMIGTSANIPYVHFLMVSLPLALVSAVLAFVMIRLFYGGRLGVGLGQQALADRRRKVAGFDEWALVKDRRIFIRCALILALTIAGFATAQQLGVGLDFVAIAGATAALLFSGFDPGQAIQKVKWPIILFFVGLFVLIGTVSETGLIELMARQLFAVTGTDMMLAVILLVPFVFVTAAIVDNIPVAATMIPVVQTMIGEGLAAEPLWWALIAACNLGGNPTPVGSIAAVIALHALERERGIRIGWGEYMKVGGSIALLQIGLVIVYIWGFWVFGLFPAL